MVLLLQKRVPDEIKSMEVDWTLSPEEIMSKEVELGCESWTSFASGCSSTAQCNGHCDCPSTAVETAIAQCTSRCAMTRGHFHCSGGGPRSFRSFSGGVRGRAFTLSPPPLPVPMKHPRFCVRKAKWSLWCRSSRRFLPSHGP